MTHHTYCTANRSLICKTQIRLLFCFVLLLGLRESPATAAEANQPSSTTQSSKSISHEKDRVIAQSPSPIILHKQQSTAKTEAATLPPYAIVAIDPRSRQLSYDSERILFEIASKVLAEDPSFIRLQAYVPASGSNALSIGMAEKPLQMVKRRLLELGVSPRKIVSANLGHQYSQLHDTGLPWVEIYLILE